MWGTPIIPCVCYWDGKGFVARFMRPKGLREKYLWEQWAIGISVVWNMGNLYGFKGKGVDLSQGPPKRKRDVVWILAVIDTPLVPAENAPSSSGWHSNVVLSSWTYHELSLHSFFLGFPKLHVEVWFFFTSFYFVWVLTIFFDHYNHDSLLSSHSIRRRRSSSDLNSQSTTSQPYLLAFLVIHFYFAYFSV